MLNKVHATRPEANNHDTNWSSTPARRICYGDTIRTVYGEGRVCHTKRGALVDITYEVGGHEYTSTFQSEHPIEVKRGRRGQEIDAGRKPASTFKKNTPLNALTRRFYQSSSGVGPTIDSSGAIHGYVRVADLKRGDRITAQVGTVYRSDTVTRVVRNGDQYRVTISNGYSFTDDGTREFAVVSQPMNSGR